LTGTSSLQLFSHSAQLLKTARHAVALTGAGISTPSGIPDFRSRASGLWERYDPFTVASLTAFRHYPEKFFNWVHPLVQGIVQAKPNRAHYALADLEKAGYLAGVITQNIDDLHRRAGSKRVYEVHGHLRQATCVACFTVYDCEGFIEEFTKTGNPPHCGKCGAILKPDVVLIGEQLPYEVVQQAIRLLEDCDLVLIAGSSLEVTPVCTFPIQPLNHGAHMIIINNDPTFLDERADVVFREDVEHVLPRIADEVLGRSTNIEDHLG
jgi:NAD-dependent deacetylase